MSARTQRTDGEIADIYARCSGTVYRVCFSYMKAAADAEDALQETFFRLIEKGPAFESEEHEKAWLIRTAVNVCKNSLKHWWRMRESLEEVPEVPGPEGFEAGELLQALLQLPEKYRTPVYLYYYEGYNSPEIGKLLGLPQSTVRNRLREARAVLKERIGEDVDED